MTLIHTLRPHVVGSTLKTPRLLKPRRVPRPKPLARQIAPKDPTEANRRVTESLIRAGVLAPDGAFKW